jgi:hypothetical protein
MTMPAEVSSAADWDRLVATLRAQYAQVDELYQRITDPGDDADEPDPTSEEEPMADPSTYPYPGYDPDADDRSAELEDDERLRLDAETDGQLDGDYDRDDDLDVEN